ncbi:hypothetical protein RN001_003093 [Aquatica leii]|uniref:Translation initiation factor eIF2B subunit delta n=1 Tax=Aquatica leii TaxID=1421715 RepID=A0AAN7Q976_9COLE|nr:hypothetical protein RN001_003093 [Aquatica leii]
MKVAAEKKDIKVETKHIQKSKNEGCELSKSQQTRVTSKKSNSELNTHFITNKEKLNTNIQAPSSILPFIERTKLEESKVKVVKEPEKACIEGLSKAEIKAQRRAIQDAQRNAKINQKSIVNDKQPEKSIKKVENKKAIPLKTEVFKTLDKHRVSLFNHLYFEEFEKLQSLKNFTICNNGVHPVFFKLGEEYRSKSILGSNARCLALLSAFKTLVIDFKTPPNQEFYRSLELTIGVCVSYLNKCRPLAVSMTNAVRTIKLLLTQSDINETDIEKKKNVLERIDRYIQDDIDTAGEAISLRVQEKVSNGDVILTYGYSSLIKRILVDAHKREKRFKVIVLDSRPLLEGKEMLRRLVCNDIPCSYLLINAASFVMSRVTKVLLGAHALLANGYVMSRTGTAQVALVANAYKKPVLVCCENYKFCERAQTDSFVYNEIGDCEALATINTSERSTELVNWKNYKKLAPLNLMYDVTPSDLVTAVVTEIAVLPCTSVPVILRIRPGE